MHFRLLHMDDATYKKSVLCCRTLLKLDSLDDACVLEEEDDMLSDKHGCPAYASPEILNSTSAYSGKVTI